MKQITEDYVSYEIAKLLKEKGFDVSTRFVWYEKLPYDLAIKPGTFNKPGIDLYFMSKTTEHNSLFDNKDKADYIEGAVYSCPSQSLALKWLREVHNIHIEIYRTACGYLYIISNIPYGTDLYNPEYGGDDENSGQWTTYEKAVEAALEYVLKNLI